MKAVGNTGHQFIIPVQAKGGTDQIGIVQVLQDLAICTHHFPNLTPHLVAVQFQRHEDKDTIVMFELLLEKEELTILDEKHYRLVPADQISSDELKVMARVG